MLRHKSFHLVAVMILGLWTIRCGKPGKSGDIHFTVSPNSPRVIATDFPINSTTTVKAPWYALNITVTNNSDETITILSIQLDTTLPTGDATQKVTVSLVPSAANFSVACGTDSQVIEYTDLGVYQPGESKPITLTYRGILGPGCPPSIADRTPLWFAGGNPAPAAGSAPIYNYVVQLKAIGWFGTLSAPTDRLDATYYYSTQ